MALALCADHELNASSFTARCIASTGASLRAAVIGGLAALSGPRHGGMTARVESFWRGMEAGDIPARLRRRLSGGEELPGFGHPLYPEGDPRAACLLERILPRFPQARVLVTAAESLTGRVPNIDFGLVTLRRFLRLPEGSAFALFALGRSVGWIAHAIEQRTGGQLIRPRAVYTGRAPGTG
jgi:citrate synthase